MRTTINCDVFNSGASNDNPVGRAWFYWCTLNQGNFRKWLKDNYNLDLIRLHNGDWVIAGEKQDCTVFVLRWS